jgi:NADPH:quinone reductase-like Zn-dependent oxidoreductase
MKAVVIHEFGEAKKLKVEEIPTPEPRADDDELLVSVKAASINPSDVKNVSGLMHGTVLPRIPGRDFAGVVIRGPEGLLGLEVWGTGGDISRIRDGSHAEYILLPRNAVTPKPTTLPMEAAGAAGLSFVTAWTAVVSSAEVSPGETVVVFGATGGTGSAAVQVAKARGATVIGVVRADADVNSVREDGADEVINCRSVNVVDAVRSLTNNRGAQVVFDGSGMMFSEAIEVTALDGRVPVIAAPPDGKASFNLRSLYRKSVRVQGIDTIRLDGITCARILAKLAPGFDSGQFKAKPARLMSLADVATAYEHAAHGSGRIVLGPLPG